jgi:type VI secretion system protein ImpF
MSRLGPQRLIPSILDRLIDPDTEAGNLTRGYTPEQMVTAVRRDLEELLNSHQSYQGVDPVWEQISNSLLTYGIPDLISVSIGSEAEKQKIARILETVIEQCEPRLRNVHATMTTERSEEGRALRFHIDAQLNMDPSPEVAFVTVVDLMTGKTSIQQRDR